MINLCRKIAESETFQSFILLIILLTAVTMGLETVPELSDQAGNFFYYFDIIGQAIFVFEISVRIIAFAPGFGKFFSEFWNTFDFTIVAASLLPGVGSFIIIARLLRAFRLLRVVSVSDKLRGFINRLHESLDEVVYTSLLSSVLTYIFSISGHYLFFEIDPANWGSLSKSFLSVFYLILLQDLKSFVSPLVSHSAFSIFYFIIFYIVFFGLALSVINAAITQSVRDKND